MSTENEAARGEAPDLHDAAERRQVERGLEEVPGIIAARLVPGFDREIDELHLVATPDKNPKQTVRDIQSFLFATFGITTDHRVISVVQFNPDDDEFGQSSRVRIDHVNVSHRGLEVEVHVQVSDGTEHHGGDAGGPASAAGRRRATARATLAALASLLDGSSAVEIEGVTITDVIGHTIAVSFVHRHSARGDQTISGTALVRDDEASAVARSVLDALNRELGPR